MGEWIGFSIMLLFSIGCYVLSGFFLHGKGACLIAGYNTMSKKEQEQVGNFIEYYLQHREQITLVIFLVDIRHTPTANDKLMYDYIIRAGLPCLILANKADKIAITKVDTEVKKIQQFLNPMLDITTLPFSSERKNYSEAVWDFLENFNS